MDTTFSSYSSIISSLRTTGINVFDCPFPKTTLDRCNALLDPIFTVKEHEYRSEIHVEKLHGLIKVILSNIETNIHNEYHFTQALYDACISEMPRLTSVRFTDPASIFKSDTTPTSPLYLVLLQSIQTYAKVKRRVIRN